MRTRTILALSLILCLLLEAPAFARMSEVMLKDGTAGIVDVLNTTEDSITVQFERNDVEIKLTLRASELDPHSFYHVRRERMEETADNHLKLAKFCIENALYAQANFQLDLAGKLDPELVADIRKDPELRERIGALVLADARRSLAAGDLENAEYLASQVASRWPETKAAEDAREMLGRVLEQAVKAEAARLEKEAAAVAAASTAEEKRAAEARRNTLAPIHASLDRGLKLQAQARVERNNTNARRAFEASTGEGEKALAQIAAVRARGGSDEALAELLPDLDRAARDLVVDGWVYAGNVLLERGSYVDAEKNANRALAADPGNPKAISLLARIATAQAQDDTFDARWRRATRPGRPGGR